MSVKGLNQLLSKLSKMEKEIVQEVDELMMLSSQEIEADAKVLAPVDLGKLRQGINAYKKGHLNYAVEAREKYSAYIEFGTGGSVDIPPEMKKIAAEFKGNNIKKINITAKAFLYPSFVKNRSLLIQDLKKLLNSKKL